MKTAVSTYPLTPRMNVRAAIRLNGQAALWQTVRKTNGAGRQEGKN